VREYIDAATPEHPSLIDTDHVLERTLGVVNIPNVVWIDEDGMIVRPAEPGWAGPAEYPTWLADLMAERERQAAEKGEEALAALRAGQDRNSYADAIRDWAANGASSPFAMSPDDVVTASRPRDIARSEAAARFELGADAWRRGDRESAFEHWRATHRLEPDNWTYKRQAWSLVGNEAAGGGELGRLMQFGIDDSWPFDGDFNRDTAATPPGTYYPKTISL